MFYSGDHQKLDWAHQWKRSYARPVIESKALVFGHHGTNEKSSARKVHSLNGLIDENEELVGYVEKLYLVQF